MDSLKFTNNFWEYHLFDQLLTQPTGLTNTPHYRVSKFLANLLNPLTQMEDIVKDPFEAVIMIHKIPPELFDQGYWYFSFDVTLFTNIPLKKTVNIILEWIYKEKLVNTKLQKNTLKKLIKDCCTKTVFSFNGIIPKQKHSFDGFITWSLVQSLLTSLWQN